MGWLFRIFMARYLGRKFGAIKGAQAGYSVLKQVPAVQIIVQKVKKVIGFILSFIGLPFLILGTYRLTEYGSAGWGWTAILFLFGSVFFIPGISFLVSAYSSSNRQRDLYRR